MKKNLAIVMLSLMLCVALLVACGGGGGSTPAPAGGGGGGGGSSAAAAAPGTSPDNPIRWQVQGFTASGTYFDTIGERLINNINDMAGGRLIIEWFSVDSIVPLFEGPAAVRDGILDATFEYPGVWASIDQGYTLMNSSPGLFWNSIDHIGWVYEGGGKELLQKGADLYNMNVRVLPAGVFDAENFLWANHPIREIEDMRGITIRMMPIMGAVLSHNGMSVAFLSASEIVPAMERGVLDAGEFSIPALDRTFGFQDVAKFVTRTGFHQPTSQVILTINMDSWNALPRDLQHIVETAGKANHITSWTNGIVENIKAEEFFDEIGITTVHLSDDAIETLTRWVADYYEEFALPGTFMREVVDSQRAYITMIAEYQTALQKPCPEWAFK